MDIQIEDTYIVSEQISTHQEHEFLIDKLIDEMLKKNMKSITPIQEGDQ